MKIRRPLYLQILFWFFLNLLVVAAATYLFVSMQFRIGFDSLLLARSAERVETLTQLVAAQLAETPRAKWNDVLERFSAAYDIGCYLFRADGTQEAGTEIEVPSKVRSQLLAPARGQRVGAAGADDGLRRRVGGPPYGRGPGARGLAPFRGPHAKFLVRTSGPRRYWLGVRIPDPDLAGSRPAAATLLFVSDSLSGGGLFLDWKPWAALAAGAVLFSVLFWLPMVRSITRAVSRMTEATGQIAEGRFEVRLHSRRPDELGELSGAIDRMASRLDGLVQGQKRFLGDVAHELCSPLARIQMALGVLEQRGGEAQRAYVDDVREEVQQMSQLVNELLLFSRASLGQRTARCQSVSLGALVRQAVEREAEGQKVAVSVEDDLRVEADPELLLRAIGNLLRNACRYAGDAGDITIAARRDGDQVRLRVEDEGPGVPEADVSRLFDPFYRLEASRCRESGGVGLGLAIVRSCVEACRGTVTARNRQPRGLQVEILLPAAERPPAQGEE